MTSARTRGRLTLLAIATLFALPIATAVYFYFSDNGWRPGDNIQLGDLINPPRTLPETPLTRDDNAPVFRDVWTLLLPAGESCDATCLDAIDKISQLRLWLGPKMSRVQTVVMPAAEGVPDADTRAANPQLIVVEPALAEEFRTVVGDYNNGQIFLVDPFGNLMMSYKPGTDMGDIRKDIGHLLRISTIG